MISAVVVVLVVLGLPGLLPASTALPRSPAVIFLAPLTGAVMAAVAVEFELGVGGSLLMWYVLVAGVVNAAALWWLVVRRRWQLGPMVPPRWAGLTAAVVIGALILPLTGLKAPMIGYDANVIWLTHALLVSGGHDALRSGLQSRLFVTTNPDYPPLVPASGALAFAAFGRGELVLAVRVTALLNACAVGIAGVGVAATGIRGSRLTRCVALLAGAGICLVGFAVAGDYAVNGFADLLWSAAALGAVVWGLVLPPSSQALAVAWLCAMVASLTKNEGLIGALIVLVLISLRYRPPDLGWLRRSVAGDGEVRGQTDHRSSARDWLDRALFVLVPLLPGLIWTGMVHQLHLVNVFFGYPVDESLAFRARATARGMAPHLVVAPIAVGVLVAGSLFFRTNREHLALGSPLWPWAACLLALASVFGTYLFGSLAIHYWLFTSVARTTIFAQLVLYTELAVWLVVVFGEAPSTRAPPSPTVAFVKDGAPPIEVSAAMPGEPGNSDRGWVPLRSARDRRVRDDA